MQVWHGADYLCLGFLFGRKSKVAYVSDVSRFPVETEHGAIYLILLLQFIWFAAMTCLCTPQVPATILVLCCSIKVGGSQLGFLCLHTNSVWICHEAVISKEGAGQVDLLFLDSLYKVIISFLFSGSSTTFIFLLLLVRFVFVRNKRQHWHAFLGGFASFRRHPTTHT